MLDNTRPQDQDLRVFYVVCVSSCERVISDNSVISAFSCICAISCVCVISAMDDGKCSPVWCVVWESIWWKGWPLVAVGQKTTNQICDRVCLAWCSISSSKQFEDVWASRLWVSGVLVLEFDPILAWYRFPAAEEFVVIFDVFFCLMMHQMFTIGEISGLRANSALFYTTFGGEHMSWHM